jgi:hypothetical protein
MCCWLGAGSKPVSGNVWEGKAHNLVPPENPEIFLLFIVRDFFFMTHDFHDVCS